MMKPQEISSLRNTIHFKVVSSKEINNIKDAKQWLTTCTNPIQTKSCLKLPPSSPMDLLSSKVSFGKTTPASNHWKKANSKESNWKWNWKRTNAPSSSSCLSTNLKVLVTIQMVFSVSHHIRIWKRRSFIIFGHSKTMELLIELWLVSVLHPKKWVKLLMHFSVDTTPHKLSVELRVLKLSRISKIGLEPGLSKAKACSTVPHQCKLQAKTLLIQLLLILEVLNFPFHQRYSIKYERNGKLLFQILIAHPIKLSATLKIHARTLLQKLSQLVSKCPITFSKSTQNNISTNLAIKNAISLSINADSQERTRTCSW